MLACERIGSGPPLVLLHGVGHRRQAWYPVVDLLAEQRELFLIDLPGHGDSPRLDCHELSVVDALHESLMDCFDHYRLDRPHVAGNSLGGRIALEAAVQGRASSVTALAPAGFWPSDRSFAYTRTVFAMAQTMSAVIGPVAPILSKTAAGRAAMFGWLLSKPGALSSARALDDFRGFSSALPAMREIVKSATPFTGELPQDVDVSIAWGTRDAVLPPYQAKVARRVVPRAQHITLPGVGHVPMSDNPRLVADVLLAGSSGVLRQEPLADAVWSADRLIS